VATPDESRKRTWRFMLNDATTLEVSSPPRATEKQVRRRGRVSLVLGTLLAALVLVAVAAADQLDADVDAFSTSPPQGNAVAANQQPGTTVEYDLSASIDETGNATDDVFKNAGDTVDVTITRSGAWLASLAGSPASFSFTAYDVNQAGKIRITVPCGTSAGTKQEMRALLTAVASNGKTLSGNPVTLTWAITAQGADAASCAPANTTPSVTADNQSFDEGTSTSYSASWSDPDASQSHTCTIDFGDGSGVQTGTISPAQPSISGTCSASHTYTDGPNSYTITVSVSDGTASGSDTATATVNNVKPNVAIDSLTGAGGVACIGGNGVTLGFSWADPAGTNDTYGYDVNWGDGSTHATASNATSPVTGLTHSYAAGGPYTIVVTVNDEDPGPGGTASSSPFSFLYNVSGVLQPVNDTQAQNDPSVFKYGSTIPVRIRVTDCENLVVTGLAPQIAVKKISGSTPPSGIDETISSTSGADTGTTMRYSDSIYIYNLATKSLADSTATYEIKITGPFSTVTTLFGTRAK
jgi:hypothetical protein